MDISVVEWLDSYGALSGWRSIEDYKPEKLICVSIGLIVYEDDDIIALAPNYAKDTEFTPLQANGLMVIPKVSITKSTTFSYSPCWESV